MLQGQVTYSYFARGYDLKNSSKNYYFPGSQVRGLLGYREMGVVVNGGFKRSQERDRKEISVSGGPAVRESFASSVGASWLGTTAWRGVEEMYYKVAV